MLLLRSLVQMVLNLGQSKATIAGTIDQETLTLILTLEFELLYTYTVYVPEEFGRTVQLALPLVFRTNSTGPTISPVLFCSHTVRLKPLVCVVVTVIVRLVDPK